MSNQQLIQRLASNLDPNRRAPVGARLAVATTVGSLVSLAAILLLLARSPHLAHGPTRTIVFAVATGSALAAVAFVSVLRLSYPEGHASPGWLWVPAAILTAGTGLELAHTPGTNWADRFWGQTPFACFALVIVFSLPILAAALYALREGATTLPGRSGAMAGLLAGGIAAALYTLHCPEDSLLFMTFWHGLAIVTVTACGVVAGKLYLRW